MTADELDELINQVTLHKLEFLQRLFSLKELGRFANREDARKMCREHCANGALCVEELKALLEALDTWGNQRIRLIRVPENDIRLFTDSAATQAAATKARLGHIFDQDMPIVVAEQVSAISIRYKEENGKRILLLVAGKIKEETVPVAELPVLSGEMVAHLPILQGHSLDGVTFYPLRLERQKIISFAEIDLDSGHGVLSVKTFAAAGSYKSKYQEFCEAFEPFLCLSTVTRTYPRVAVYQILRDPDIAKVNIPQGVLRTDAGNRLSMKMARSRQDIRTDEAFSETLQQSDWSHAGDYCECYWQPDGVLKEEVHTHIYGAHGEVTFRGQLREESVNHVLQRIRSLNN